jgi:enoyl-CoA hydratase/carnithine racemase
MALVPDPIDARESERYGLVSRVVPDDQLIDTAQEMAERMASFPPSGLAYMKHTFAMASESSFDTMLRVEEEIDAICFASEETQAALRAFLESRRRRKEDAR